MKSTSTFFKKIKSSQIYLSFFARIKGKHKEAQNKKKRSYLIKCNKIEMNWKTSAQLSSLLGEEDQTRPDETRPDQARPCLTRLSASWENQRLYARDTESKEWKNCYDVGLRCILLCLGCCCWWLKLIKIFTNFFLIFILFLLLLLLFYIYILYTSLHVGTETKSDKTQVKKK